METNFNIITSQISDTNIHRGLWANILSLAGRLEARVGVVANYRENANALLKEDSDEVNWVGHPETEPYLLIDEKYEDDYLTVRADINVVPKAASPLNQVVEFLTKGKHLIIGHPQVAVESLPRPIDAPRTTAYTTGTITCKDTPDLYRRSVSEQKAKFHHSLGFLVTYGPHVWPIYAERDGSFNFFNLRIADGEITKENVPWAVWGDIHYPNQDKEMVKQATEFCGRLGVKSIVLHDVADFQAGSHHQKPVTERSRCPYTVTEEFGIVCQHILALSDRFGLHIIDSNHHDHIEKWLDRPHKEVDPRDLEFYFAQNLNRITKGKKVLELATEGVAKYYSEHSPLVINGITQYHGHNGICGAKGSAQSIYKGTTRAIVGHTHSEQIHKGVMNPGCMAQLPQSYQSGLTKSTQGLALIHESGKRQLVTASGQNLVPEALLNALE
jgi:hypothetical protein